MTMPTNKIERANRRTVSPLSAGPLFGRALRAASRACGTTADPRCLGRKILATISPISTDQPNTLEEAKPLLNAAAVVTDVGAPRSHAAIVARELGIPAVVGCGNATMRLHTCDRVR